MHNKVEDRLFASDHEVFALTPTPSPAELVVFSHVRRRMEASPQPNRPGPLHRVELAMDGVRIRGNCQANKLPTTKMYCVDVNTKARQKNRRSGVVCSRKHEKVAQPIGKWNVIDIMNMN